MPFDTPVNLLDFSNSTLAVKVQPELEYPEYPDGGLYLGIAARDEVDSMTEPMPLYWFTRPEAVILLNRIAESIRMIVIDTEEEF